jgi:phosphoinositide-3-kinase regulatory subunit 4
MTQTSTLNPSDALIWPEYILPNLRHLALDPASSVRIVYAQLLAAVAETSVKFLEMGQALKMQSNSKSPRTDYDLQSREVK